jgi:hypothetical protein
MDENDEVRRPRDSMLEDMLEERMTSIEREREALLQEIRSSLTSQDRREEAFAQRVNLAAEWTALEQELRALRGAKAS